MSYHEYSLNICLMLFYIYLVILKLLTFLMISVISVILITIKILDFQVTLYLDIFIEFIEEISLLLLSLIIILVF